MDASQARAGSTTAVRIVAVNDGKRRDAFDDVATEEPLEIRLQHAGETKSLAVTMRTPGHDFELVAGFLLAEGIVTDRSHIERLSYCVDKSVAEEQRFNIVNAATPHDTTEILERLQRHFAMSSACGVCGKAQLEALEQRGVAPINSDARVSEQLILGLPERLREAQRVFATTGGLHAAALFDLNGALRAVREDVGRHNAMDKLCGWALLENQMPLGDCVALVSGRSSFEIVQKAAVSRIPILCAVSAPSSLAVEVAAHMNMTLIGFLRPGRFNIYTVPDRITS